MVYMILTSQQKKINHFKKLFFIRKILAEQLDLFFNIDKDNQDLGLSSAAELELAMILAKGKESESKYLVKPTIIDGVRGIAEYSLTDSQIAHDGNAIAEIVYKIQKQSSDARI